MLAAEQNELLTRVGAEAPMGQLLRRYWHPIAAVAQLQKRPSKRIRLLGEDLVLFRTPSGKLGLLAETCPHRSVSLSYGMIEPQGLRCMYHGWLFGLDGQCLEQPNEPAESGFASRIKTAAYPVQELGGLIFAYLGPQPVPVLPRWDVLTWGKEEGVLKQVGAALLPCNWLQIMENSVDPIHGEWLHGKYAKYLAEQKGVSSAGAARLARNHVKVGFDLFEWGIIKRRVLEGQTEEAEDWRIGHPLVFPTMLKVGGNGRYDLQFRVPVDDTHTWHVWYQAIRPGHGIEIPDQDPVPYFDMPFTDENGDFLVDFINGQDIMAWVTQGPITDRSREHLGTTDKGLILLRKLLREQLERVAAGQDPMGVIREDPATGCIELPMEEDKLGAGLNPTATIFESWRTANDPQVQSVIDQLAAAGS